MTETAPEPSGMLVVLARARRRRHVKPDRPNRSAFGAPCVSHGTQRVDGRNSEPRLMTERSTPGILVGSGVEHPWGWSAAEGSYANEDVERGGIDQSPLGE